MVDSSPAVVIRGQAQGFMPFASCTPAVRLPTLGETGDQRAVDHMADGRQLAQYLGLSRLKILGRHLDESILIINIHAKIVNTLALPVNNGLYRFG